MKGSFPLDHDGLCKRWMLQYLLCLEGDGAKHRAGHRDCRALAQQYLHCRMQHNLMAKEEWPDLGFDSEPGPQPADRPQP